MPRVIAADIGGTNCRLGLFETRGQELAVIKSLWLPTAGIANANDFLLALAEKIGELESVDALAAAIAGPVLDSKHGKLTNAALELDFNGIEHHIPRIGIINDFMAQAYYAAAPEAAEAEKIIGPDAGSGTRAVLGAGTGLGQAALLPHNGGYIATPSENGHNPFPFLGAAENSFAAWFCGKTRLPYACGDDVLSGRGLALLHLWLTGEDLNAEEIGARYLGGENETSAWYARFYARACRCWILATLCVGGLWIAGGIAARNPACVKSENFKDELFNSARWADFLRAVPVYLTSDTDSGLRGAARFALAMLNE